MDNATREIYVQSDGVVNGNILTVASSVLWGDTKRPIDGLRISNAFNSANGVPVGSIKAFNDYYDELTGLYWFDLRVKELTGPFEYVIGTTAEVAGESIPLRFIVKVKGETKAIVSGITFDADVIKFNVSAKSGRLLRYPLAPIAKRGIENVVAPDKGIGAVVPHAFSTLIANNTTGVYSVLGKVSIDNEENNFLMRVGVSTINGDCILTRPEAGKLHADVVLTGNKAVKVRLPIQYETNGSIGTINRIDNFVQEGNKVTFDFGILELTSPDHIRLDLILQSVDDYNAPTFIHGDFEGARWNNAQTNAKVSILKHFIVDGVETVNLELLWENGDPVRYAKYILDGQRLVPRQNGSLFTLSREVDVEGSVKKTINASGAFDLSAYGIDEPVTFSDDLEVGDDVYPVRVVSSFAQVIDDKVTYFFAIRRNDGNIFTSVEATAVSKTVNSGTVIRNQNYDADSGILSVDVDLVGSIKYPGINVQPTVGIKTEAGEFSFSNVTLIKVEYEIFVTGNDYFFEQSVDGKDTLVKLQWSLKGNDGKIPDLITANEIRLNAKPVKEYTKQYNASTGVLTITTKANGVPGDLYQFTGTVSSYGHGKFIMLDYIQFKWKKPGSARQISAQVEDWKGEQKFVAKFEVYGWKSTNPNKVIINDGGWVSCIGVNHQKVYSEYDKKTGILTVVFNVLEKDAELYSGMNTIQISTSDPNKYLISFTTK